MAGMPGGNLESLIKRGRVILDRDLLARHEIPERGERGLAAFVVEPDDPAELSMVARWGFENQARLVIQGANTGLVGASVPDSSGTQGIVSTSRMSRIIDLSLDDRAVVVEAGITLDELNQAVASEGLFFPVEVGSNPTIGGLVATNAGGARTIRYGDMSKNVLGLEAVVADSQGSTVGQVSMLEKDNSRLNLTRLFVGSYGTLGVVSRVALRLARTPRQVAACLVALDSHHQAPRCLEVLENLLGPALSAFELISGDALRMTFTNVGGLRKPFPVLDHDCYLLIEAISHDSDDIADRLAGALDRVGPTLADAVIAPPADLWRIRHSLSEGVRSSGATLRFDISVPRALLPVLTDRVRSFAATVGSPAVTQFGHWGDGGTHLQLVYPDRVLPDDAEMVRAGVYDIVVGGLGGSFSAEHGLGPHNAAYYTRYVPPAERELELRLKALFDPRGVWGREPFST